MKIDDEWNRNMRYYGDLRFKQLTVYLAWLTIVAFGISQSGDKVVLGNASIKVILAFASMLVTAVIWLMEISSSKYWVAFKKKLDTPWPCNEHKFSLFDSTNVIVLFYISCYVFWWYSALFWNGSCIFLVVYAAVFIIVLMSNIFNYIPLWKYKYNLWMEKRKS